MPTKTTSRSAPQRSTPPPPKRPRLTLSRELIADTALEIANRDGVDSLTMRRLAEQLGIGTMTLYGYFKEKKELLDFAIDRAAGDFSYELPRGSWHEQMRELMLTIRQALAAHPAMVQLRRSTPLLSPVALKACETGMQIMLDAGFSRETAAYAWRTLFVYTFGFAAFHKTKVPASVEAAWRDQLRALPQAEYPALSSALEEAIGTMSGEDAFEFGLGAILDGLESQR